MSKKLTIEDFIYRARKVHNDRFDYSESQYIDSYTKIKIICNKHGIFEQTSGDHLGGKGCQKCGREITGLKNRKTTVDFIADARRVHGDKYDYSSVLYEGLAKNITIICKTHGEFTQLPADHLFAAAGCKKCSNEKALINKEDFVARATLIHGDLFDYSEVEDTCITHKIKISCRQHGEFQQIAGHHLNGQGCFKCANDLKRNSQDYQESYDSYVSFVKSITEDSYRSHRNKINPSNLERGTGKYHIDHIYSKNEGFKNNILPEIMGHWTNLQMLKHQDNSSKSDRCDKSIEKLYEDYYKEIK